MSNYFLLKLSARIIYRSHFQRRQFCVLIIIIMTAHLFVSTRPENQLDSTTVVIIKSFMPSTILNRLKLSTYIYKAMRIETGVTKRQ